jgi:coenzyme F420-reducing hydrogenase alpha subunit
MSDWNATGDKKRVIRIEALARVEGEGALDLTYVDGRVETVQLRIYEPPRFYEAFLRGRHFQEVPDITARICGICPIAYQMGACHALEKALGVFNQIPPPVRALRNLFYCGEWIESHVLHMFLLHLPDFLGCESALSVGAAQLPLVKRSLRLKKLGNELVSLLGGRSVHPVAACVGGFYKAPDRARAQQVLPEVRACLEDACDVVLQLAGQIQFPAFERDYEFVALCPDDEYPMNLGPIKSSKGLHADQEEFGQVIEEHQVPHSHALHARIRGRGPYQVGPLARLNLNADKLHPRAAEILTRVCAAVGQPLPWRNTYLSLLARGVEVVHALGLAADILQSYQPPLQPRVPVVPRAGIGGHGTEAPRGLCWHQYRTESDGTIASARIIPPTSQNQATIEADLLQLAPQVSSLSDDEAALRCEHLIRNYDPCISCATHFLNLTRTSVVRSPATGGTGAP